MFQKFFGGFREWSLLPLRFALGWIFIAHGGQKLFGLWGGHGLQGFATMLESMGLHPAMPLAILAASAEFFGGLMVLFGFYARFGAFLITVNMAVAVATVHAPKGFFMQSGGYEYNVALIAICLCILFAGSGRWSIKQG